MLDQGLGSKLISSVDFEHRETCDYACNLLNCLTEVKLLLP